MGCVVLLVTGALLLIALLALWLGRERLADNFIQDYFATNGVEARYEITRIGPDRQVLRNLSIGDRAHPDLTVEQVEVLIRPRFGLPDITRVRLLRPRLHGSVRQGKLSFGALDPLIFTGSKEPFQLPRMDLAVDDGRALIDGDYGPIGIKLQGTGALRGGFAGEVAAVAPRLAAGGCVASGTTLYGRIAVIREQPAFDGPLRFAGFACSQRNLALGKGAVQLGMRTDKALTSVQGTAGLDLAGLRQGANSLRGLQGTTRYSWRPAGLALDFDLAGKGVATSGAGLATVALDGRLRARPDMRRVEVAGTFSGSGPASGPELDGGLRSAIASTHGTLLAPLLQQLRSGVARQAPGSTLAGEFDLRLIDGRLALVMPDARLKAQGGQTLVALSRVQLASGNGEIPRLSGNFLTGGAGLPQITGRMEQRGGDATRFRLHMAPYRAGSAVLEVPDMAVVQGASGAIGFSGQVRASGALPGGAVQGLVLPLSGRITSNGALAVGLECADLAFERMQLASLTLDRHRLTLCPPPGSAMVRRDGAALRIAASTSALALKGHVGDSPLAVRSGAVTLAWPGDLSANRVAVTLGPAEAASHFGVERLTGRVGPDLHGTFAGAEGRLFAVPLDLIGAAGTWRYDGGRLTLGDGAFRVQDRQAPARFNPLVARSAVLALQDSVITAKALLREPGTDREVSTVNIRHDLASGRGQADLAVAGLTFDKGLQPATLTSLAKGLVANVAGTINGSGRIDWSPQGVTSGGRFSSDSLDLAAAFGPVKGAAGTVEFTDLLGLTTAPDQQIRIASVNPGIEANNGIVTFQLEGGQLLRLGGGTWPFLGGTLRLRPLEMRFGNAETRRYVLELEGLDAARFIERMELSNLAVTGTFDGTIPVVFDEQGNGRLEGGVLVARPPGGNIAYVGKLTYEDMGAIPNFAFSALRSLDYKQMMLQMDGSLTGEIVTRVRFDGVSQGAGARQNFLTRQVAKLPFRFDVNVRAPFYALITSIRAMYDPAFIRDPREIGLIDSAGKPVTPQGAAPKAGKGPIQPSESEDR
ncbi:MAG: hypothetical protein RLZZ08_1844 [Pseudomonadota bacterium]